MSYEGSTIYEGFYWEISKISKQLIKPKGGLNPSAHYVTKFTSTVSISFTQTLVPF